MEYSLRPATVQDLDTILKWVPTADLLCTWGGPTLAFPPEPREVWRAIQADDRNTLSLVDRLGTLVGFGQLLPREPGTVHLARIIVSPEWRGRGLGRLLCQRLIEHASRHFQPSLLTLKVYVENQAAVSLYRSLGFAEAPEAPGAGAILMKRPVQRG